MNKLAITLIDVGWGDSIFLEAETDEGAHHYALVDCNDTNVTRSALLFVKRYLEKKGVEVEPPMFDFVLLTHAHADHVCGIKQMLQNFGTDWYWYPKSDDDGAFATTLRYANRSSRVSRHQAIDRTKIMPPFGAAQMKVLWPPYSPDQPYDTSHPNNNSVVLLLTLGQVRFVLTGDCEAENWHHINDPELRSRVKVFKFPHHGSRNGLFDDHGNTPWLDKLGVRSKIAMSLHVRHGHPHPETMAKLSDRGFRKIYRTDENYHLTFTTNGSSVSTKWSRV
jgi:beta-lactamase superfamily II metal-dependent hydrolase